LPPACPSGCAPRRFRNRPHPAALRIGCRLGRMPTLAILVVPASSSPTSACAVPSGLQGPPAFAAPCTGRTVARPRARGVARWLT
jgi:hypothetical protein